MNLTLVKGRDKEERKEKEEEGIDVDGMIYDPELSVSFTARCLSTLLSYCIHI